MSLLVDVVVTVLLAAVFVLAVGSLLMVVGIGVGRARRSAGRLRR